MATVHAMLERDQIEERLASPDPNAPLQSLQKDGGAGALLAAAAGDVAGRNLEGTYGANTQIGTVLAYHLMRNGEVDRDVFRAEVMLLDGVGETHQVYRGEEPDLRAWLDSVRNGNQGASTHDTCGPAVRALPAGLKFRHDPEALVTAALRASRMTNLNAASVLAAAIAAGAVAASSFHQIGKDLYLGVAETADRAVSELAGEEFRYSDMDRALQLPARIRDLCSLVDADLKAIVSELSGDNGPQGVDGVLLAIAIAGNKHFDAVRLIDAAAQAGGSNVGSITGAIVGARQATSMWPWRVPNDTWFAEIGRRLVAGETETRDLPIPYAVEERPILRLDMIPSNDE
jgi:ADP-ribosylglycohydrolase